VANGADRQCSATPAAALRCGAREAVRCHKKPKPKEAAEPEQYQPFDAPECRYRVFVTKLEDRIDLLVWFYNQRAGAENPIAAIL
jgi:hypothetical protein